MYVKFNVSLNLFERYSLYIKSNRHHQDTNRAINKPQKILFPANYYNISYNNTLFSRWRFQNHHSRHPRKKDKKITSRATKLSFIPIVTSFAINFHNDLYPHFSQFTKWLTPYTRDVPLVRASFAPDETVPRIIKLAKYFRATAVITQPRGRSFYSPLGLGSLSSSAGEAEPPASVRTMDRSRDMDAHLSSVYA